MADADIRVTIEGLLAPRDVAPLLGISAEGVRKLVQRGTLAHYTTRNGALIPREAVADLAQQRAKRRTQKN